MLVHVAKTIEEIIVIISTVVFFFLK